MLKKTAALISVLMLCVMLTACGEKINLTVNEAVEKEAATGESWTVMLYMSGGENENINGNASDALKDMTKFKYPENINVVVQTGGAYGWKLGGIDTNYIDRFEMQHKSMRLIERQELTSMGKSSTLKDYINWCKDNYQSDHYALIIYGAGGGIYGVGHDQAAMADRLSAKRIGEALSAADEKFDIIGFDAGFCASAEMAAELSNYTDYIIASQEEMAKDGWNYRGWLKYIAENPTASMEQVAAAVCDTYMEQCKNKFTDKMATMSVISTEKFTELTQAVDSMASYMNDSLDDLADYNVLAQNLDNTLCFGANSEDEGYTNMADLGSVAKACVPVSEKSAQRVQEKIDESVIHKVSGKYRKDASGISIYYPYRHDTSELEGYMETAPSDRYAEFLRKICTDVVINGKKSFENTAAYRDYVKETELLNRLTVAGTTGLELNMVGDMNVIKDVRQRLFLKSEHGMYLNLGVADAIDENKDAGIYRTKNEFKALRVNGNYVQLNKVCDGDGYSIYTSPVKIDGELMNLRFVREGNKFKCLGMMRSLGNANQSYREYKKVHIYNKLTPMYRDYQSGELTEIGGFKTWPFGMRLKYTELKDGMYRTDFVTDDVYDKSEIIGSADFTVSQGTLAYTEQR